MCYKYPGDIGGIYPSAIQAVLPRLLSAAVPPGNTALENRRQCLKASRGIFPTYFSSLIIVFSFRYFLPLPLLCRF